MAGELPEDIKATLSILDSQTPPPPASLKTTRTMADIALPTKRQPTGGDDVSQTLAILDGKEPEPVATAGEPDPRDIEVDVLKLALRKGINSNTALAAHRQSVARKLNISPALVTPQAEESAFYQDHDPEDLHKNYPALAKYLKIEGNAELVGKNIEPMKELEVFFRRAVQDPEIVAAKGVVGAVQTLVGLGNLVSAGKAGKYVEEHGIDLKKIQSVLNDLYSPEAQAALKSVEEAEGFLGTLTAALKNPSSIGLFVGESLPQMYLGRVFGSGLKTAFPGLSFGAAGAAGEGITMAGGSAEQIRSATEDGELTAGQAALSVGVGVAGTAISAFGAKLATKLGIEDVDAALVAGKLLSRLEDSGVPKQLAVRLVGGAAIEGAVEEMPQSVVEQIAQNVALGRAWDEGVPESAALGLVTGGAMGAAVQVGAVRGKQPIVAETPAEKQARTTVQNSILKTAAAVNAEEQRNAIKEWGQRVASNNPLRKEAPDSFKEFVRTMAEEDGALKEVYVDGKLLRESLAQAGIDEDKLKSTMPEVAESLGEALATNGEARIPIEDYAAHIVGTPVEQAILDHLRTTPEGMTYAEAQVYFQEQQDDFIKQAEALVSLNEPVLSRKEFEAQAPEGVKYRDYLAAHKNKVEVFAKDLETVHDKLLEGLDSTGRFPKSISRVYAIPFREFYATNAARMGVLPSELYDNLPLNFSQMSTEDILSQSPEYKGHLVNSGGLQGHSLGELYPYMIVGRQKGYQLLNGATGELYPLRTDVAAAINDKPTGVATFADFGGKNVENIMNKSGWMIMSAWNPNNTVQSKAKNDRAHARLLAELKKLGLEHEVVMGRYGEDETESPSVLILGADYKTQLRLVREYQQESVLINRGLLYQDGSINAPASKVQVFKSGEKALEKTGAYTRVPSTGTIFSMDFDFSGKNKYKPDDFGKYFQSELKQPDSLTLTGVHYSKEQRSHLEGKYFGTGLPGAERDRLSAATDKRILNRVDFYVDTGDGVVPESGLGNVRHEVPLQNIYDASKNERGFRVPSTWTGMNDFESQVLDAGYDGYFVEQKIGNKKQGRVVVLGQAADSIPTGTENGQRGNEGVNDAPQILNQSAFYSALQREIPSISKIADKNGMVKTDQAIAWIEARQKEGKFKLEEVEAVGLKDWLQATEGKVSVMDIENFVVENGVQIEETLLGEPSNELNNEPAFYEYDEDNEQYAVYSYRIDSTEYYDYEGDAAARVDELNAGKTKFEQYKLPGGENYRELLLTLPKTEGQDFRSAHYDEKNILAHVRFDERVVERKLTPEESEAESRNEILRKEADVLNAELGEVLRAVRAEMAPLRDEITTRLREEALKRDSAPLLSDLPFRVEEEIQKLPPTENQKKIAAIRDRLDGIRAQMTLPPDTKERILFIEEVQSDWAQEGRKKGFTKAFSKEDQAEMDRIDEEAKVIRLRMAEDYPNWKPEDRERAAILDARYQDLYLRKVGGSSGGIPTAPFVQNTKSWVTLAVKRILRYAAENGYSKIAWTNGAQQAARYDLSKQISEIRYSNGYLKAYDLDNKLVLNKSSVTEEELPGIIGKEVAQKLLEQPKEGEGKMQVLSGLDLKVGGEGMLAFYDKLLPQVVNDVAKKLGGGKVGATEILSRRDNQTEADFLSWAETNEPGMPENVLRRLWKKGETDEVVKRFMGEGGAVKQPSLEITPEMREKILSGLPLFQGQRAGFDPSTFTISLLKGADLSSVIHEGAHFYLEALADLAGRENAPQQIKDDFRTTLNWFELPEGSDWRSMTLDQKRPYHEQWAQSYERYTLEGKAPTVEMQSVFSRFREWMLSVYKSMKDFLAQNPLAGKLNDDIRAVFDRLIASEDKIYQAEEARGYSALFGSAAEAGLSEKEFEDYQNLGKLASLRAVDEMNGRSIRDMRWLSNAKDKTIRKLQAEAKSKRAAVMAQVTDEVDSMPLNRARNFLTKGEFIDETGVRRESDTKFKLNTEEVKALSNGQVPANLKNMVAPDGIGLELAAKLLGFQSPETLVNDLANGESRDVTIQGLTDQRMLEQYGDLIDDKAIERAAEKAIHNEARARFIATGLKILAKTELSATQLNRAAKLAAEATIAKKKIRALTPGQFTRAEAKANREAIESVAKDPRKAIEAQRAALLNNRLAKAALEASEEVDSILKYFKKFESQGVRKAVGIDQIDQIDDLLQTVDRDKSLPLREIDKRQALAEWVAEQEADGFEPVLDPILAEQIKAKHYKEMTVDELRMLRDTVKQIEHVGRLKQTLLTEMRRADFRERVEEAEASIRDNANRTVKERGTPTDVAGITGQWVRQMIASHRKFSSYMREMDGGKDGGVMWRLLSKNMNAAGDREIEMRRASGEAIAELFKGFKQEKAPLNLYAKRTQIPGTEIFMTQEQRIMFGMNWGNEGNRQRLLDGGITGKRALSITEAQAVLDTLTKEEWDFIQGTWDHIATYKDQIAALERKLTGIEPEWIEPAEIKTKYGTYRGGYLPAKYDIELSSRSESFEAAIDSRMAMKGAFNAAATRKSFVEGRAKAVVDRPLLLSYNVIANHISEVTHRLAWQPWLIDANRILKALDAPIREHYGAEVLRELRNTVIDIAAGDIGARTPMERAINHLRTGSTIVGMGWRFSTAFLQPSGLAQSWARIGGRWMAKGIAETFKNLNSAGEFVNSKSSLMKNRDITMNREVREVLDRIRTTEGVNAVTGSYFSLIAKVQRMVDIPTWMGAYEKALHDMRYEDAADAEQRARVENDAVALADQAVVDSQSGGQIKDLASIQRGHPGLKLFTNFYSYFSATYNLNIEALRRTNFRSPTDVAFLASDLILLNVLPVIFAVALTEMTKGKCGDDIECLAASYGYEQMGFMFGQMVLLRDAGSAALVAAGGDQYGYSGPAGLRFFSDLYKAGVQANQGELDWPLFKSVSNTAGVLLHFPTGQINTTLEGIIAVENGDVDGVSILPALLFGPPKD